MWRVRLQFGPGSARSGLWEENMAVLALLCWLFMDSVHPLCSVGGFWEVLDVSAAVTPLGGGGTCRETDPQSSEINGFLPADLLLNHFLL